MQRSLVVLGGVVLAGLLAGEVGAVAPLHRAPEFSTQSLPPDPEFSRELLAQSAEADEALRLYQEGRELLDQGTAESLRGAIEKFEAAILLLQASGDIFGEAVAQYYAGLSYARLGFNTEALEYYGCSHEFWQKLNQQLVGEDLETSQTWQARTLNAIGAIYSDFGEKQKALEYYNESLSLRRVLEDRRGEAQTLNNIGRVHEDLGEIEKAIEFLNLALSVYQEIGNQSGEATVLNNIGSIYDTLGDMQQALKYYNQALPIRRVVEDRAGEAATLNNIGHTYDALGEKQKALTYYQQALSLIQEIGDRSREAIVINNIAHVYDTWGEKQQALEFYNQALLILRAVGDRGGEATTLNNIGVVYGSLGEKSRALEYFEQALPLRRAVGDRGGEAMTLNNIGLVYDSLKEKSRALEYYEQALLLIRVVSDRGGEARILNNIGWVYDTLGEESQALEYYNQALPLLRAVGDLSGEAVTLNNLGLIYKELGESEKALEYYNQALPLLEATGYREGLGQTLFNIGYIFADQNQPEVAIIFLKESVRVRETIRTDNRQLDEQLRQTYITTIEDDYRFLANLLLEQARIPEAQQVLDLLKLEELRDFTNTRASFTSDGQIRYTDPEQAVLNDHNSLIALGTTILTCEDSNCNDLDRLYRQLEGLKAQYNAQLENFITTIRANRANDDLFQNLDNLSSQAEKLLIAYNEAGQNTVLIYPFVLEDKLWLVWAAAGGVIGSIEVPVTQAELAQTVHHLGQQLKTSGNIQASSQQLYDWIIKPLESELTANEIDHLVFVNDRVTRYIPMGALFDGEQYLLEKYTISSVLAPSLTDTNSRLNHQQTNVLGLGLTDAIAGFNPLPAVQAELEAIITQGNNPGVYPGQVFLNTAFTLDNLKTNVLNHNVLHLATHAEFVPGRADESYILLGDGGLLKTADIDVMERRLRNLQLVVLSACQTALGGEAGDGTEIAGISSYFLKEGRAKTVIASLWSVNDSSTSVLMQRFYALLSTGELTQAEALRQAQLSLLYREETADFETRVADSRSLVSVRPRNGAATPTAPGFSHPYHWSPFILIGNGL
jgi:CHAT domain-containing protein/Tfp pilus assembly protein PilF